MSNFPEYQAALRAQTLNSLTDGDLTMIANALQESARQLQLDAREAQRLGNDETAEGCRKWSEARRLLAIKIARAAGWGWADEVTF